MFKFADLDKKICLTCHYYRINRKVEVIGSKVNFPLRKHDFILIRATLK